MALLSSPASNERKVNIEAHRKRKALISDQDCLFAMYCLYPSISLASFLALRVSYSDLNNYESMEHCLLHDSLRNLTDFAERVG